MADPDYFTIAEFQALPDCAGFGEPEIVSAAAFFTEIVEREIGAAMIPRTYSQTFDGASPIVLAQRHLRSVTSVTVDGVAVDVDDLTYSGGVIRYLSGESWTNGIANVVVTYTAGEHATCPADVKSAVMWATRDRLLSQSGDQTQDPRLSSMTNELGGTMQYVLPGEKRPTGYPELDAVIASRRRSQAPLIGS